MSPWDTSWESICNNPLLQDLPYKIETNHFNKIIMSPASSWHGGFEAEIAAALKSRLPAGRVINECAVETSDGIKVVDVSWISRPRYAPYTGRFHFRSLLRSAWRLFHRAIPGWRCSVRCSSISNGAPSKCGFAMRTVTLNSSHASSRNRSRVRSCAPNSRSPLIGIDWGHGGRWWCESLREPVV